MKLDNSSNKTETGQKPINFAVIGCGMLARLRHIPNIARSKKAVLHTCCDLDDEALAECQKVHGAEHISKDFHQVINDPQIEAVCLATTEKLRLPVIELAAKAGKAVYCEKPLARTLDEMYEIQKVVNESGIPFCVGHNRRSSPAIQQAHRIFGSHMDSPVPCKWRFDREGENRANLKEDGTAGMSVRINDDWYSWKSWVFDPEQAPHGPMLFEMTHFTDLCNWFLAARPAEVTALESGMLNHGVIIRYETGELATLMLCANGTFGYPKELYEMFGNGGAVIVDHMVEVRTAGIENAEHRMTFPMLKDRHPDIGSEGGISGWLAKKQTACKEASEHNDPNLSSTAEPDKGHAHAIDRFVDEITGSVPVVCSVDEAVLATRVAFAAISAANKGRTVKMNEI